MSAPLPAPAVPLRALLSFHYWQNTDVKREVERAARAGVKLDLIADSGAFSARSMGMKIEVPAYAAWLDRWREHFSAYPNLDVIGDPERSWANQQQMERDYGLRPIPVVHAMTPHRWLDQYLDLGHRYLALGGLLLAPTPTARMRWLVECFKRAEPYGAVFHAFGNTAGQVARDLPWYSVDSSTWCSGFRFGNCPAFDSKTCRITFIQPGGSGSHRTKPFEHGRTLRRVGADPLAIAKFRRGVDSFNRDWRFQLSGVAVDAFLRFEHALRRRLGTRVRPAHDGTHPNDDGLGVKIYFAVSPGDIWETLLFGYCRATDRDPAPLFPPKPKQEDVA